MSKRVTNNDIYIKLEVLAERVHNLQEDIEEVKEMAPRLKSLELFRSYVKGGFAVVAGVLVAIKGIFNHF